MSVGLRMNMVNLKKMKIVNWLNDVEALKFKNIYLSGKNFQYGQRWKEYITQFVPDCQKRLEILRQYIIENNIRKLTKEFKDTNPLFDDNVCVRCSFRAWGDLLAATWSEEENKDYMYTLFTW
jgi:hypothetical protein